jgi:hypothetical protein
MNKSSLSVVCAAPLLAMVAFAAADFETPPSEPPSASLTPEQVKGENFHIADPVQSDGLMHHYVIESRYGTIPAYGRETLLVRLHEIAALNEISHTPKAQVVMASVLRSATPDAPGLLTLATHPVSSVTGIPAGIVHLLAGYAAQAKEFGEHSNHAGQTAKSDDKGPAAQQKAEDKKKDDNEAAAVHYAQRYLGITGAERRSRACRTAARSIAPWMQSTTKIRPCCAGGVMTHSSPTASRRPRSRNLSTTCC